jgi:hypothetical protein
MQKSSESKLSKKQIFIDKLKNIDEENERMQADILRMMNGMGKLIVNDKESKHIVEEIIKVARKINEKSILERKKTKSIYHNIKGGIKKFKK